MSLSDRLKAAREKTGWTVEEVGARLHLPARVIQRIEAGDFEALGAPVYRRGYLRSFARLVDVAEDEVEAALNEQRGNDPELVATGVMPRGQYVTERYLRPVTYMVLTALIAVPVVWYAASGRLGEELARSRSFDLRAPVAVSDANPTPGSTAADSSGNQHGRNLMRASLLPVPPEQVTVVPRTAEPSTASDGQPAQAPVADAPTPEPAAVATVASDNQVDANVIGAGHHLVVLELTGDSWVNVLDADGRRVHQSLLKPGTWQFRSDSALSFTIGNSSQAQLQVDGETIDLTAHRSSSDVARVEVLKQDG